MRALPSLAVLLALTLVACGGGKTGDSETESKSDSPEAKAERKAKLDQKKRRALKRQLQAFRVALFNYKSDNGVFPRLAPRPASVEERAKAYQDDAHALYSGLQNEPTLRTGGGQNSPYLHEWSTEDVGFLDRAFLSADKLAEQREGAGVTPLTERDRQALRLLNFQEKHDPASPKPLVFLDPWGNPLHYREWASVRTSIKSALLDTPTKREINATKRVLLDKPHDVEGFDIWSNGPNGINELGHPDSDDVATWGELD